MDISGPNTSGTSWLSIANLRKQENQMCIQIYIYVS